MNRGLIKREDGLARRDIFERFLSDFFEMEDMLPAMGKERMKMPAVDISEEKNMYIVTADLPGMKQEDIKVEVENNILTISGERSQEKEEKDEKKTYHYYERSYGRFERSFNLPGEVDPDKIKASYKNGELRLEIPKTGETRAKQIKIE